MSEHPIVADILSRRPGPLPESFRKPGLRFSESKTRTDEDAHLEEQASALIGVLHARRKDDFVGVFFWGLGDDKGFILRQYDPGGKYHGNPVDAERWAPDDERFARPGTPSLRR